MVVGSWHGMNVGTREANFCSFMLLDSKRHTHGTTLLFFILG